MLHYPITLTKDTNGTFLVGFPDFPEGNSVGNDEEDAIKEAEDALLVVMDMYCDDGRAIPLPSVIEGAKVVTLRQDMAAIVLVWNEMRARGIDRGTMVSMFSGCYRPLYASQWFEQPYYIDFSFAEKVAEKLGMKFSLSLT